MHVRYVRNLVEHCQVVRADQCDPTPHHSLRDGERLRYVQFQENLLDLDDLRHCPVGLSSVARGAHLQRLHHRAASDRGHDELGHLTG